MKLTARGGRLIVKRSLLSAAAELRANGAVIREGPVDRNYHMRELIVSDLNGTVLAFGEATPGRAT